MTYTDEAELFEDSFKYKGMRRRMAQEVARKGVNDPRILEALESIPRHFFVETAFAEQSYEDKAFPISAGQTISQPYTVAYQTWLLDVQPGDKILEIGTGSGYQASVLAWLGGDVYSIERHAVLSKEAAKVLNHLGLKVNLFIGDGSLGLPDFAPFDKILVTAGAPVVPDTLVEQLRIGGYMVIPVGGRAQQQMLRITKNAEGTTQQEVFESFRFVPLIGHQGW